MPWFSGKKKANTDVDESNSTSEKFTRDTARENQQHYSEKEKEKGKTSASRGKAAAAPASPATSTSSLQPERSPEKKSPTKKSHTSSVRDREKGTSGSGSGKERPKSPRHSRSFGRGGHSRKASDEHPLNLHPDELRRLSSRMSVPSSPAPQENGTAAGQPEPMETTPAPESVPGGFPTTNGVNGDKVAENGAEDADGEAPPVPPPHAPVDAEACKASGNKFYKAGQYERAIAEYTKAIEAEPKTATYLSNRAAAYMSASKYLDALEDCKTADELDPKNAKILHRMAKIYTALGRPQEALDVYDRIEPPATAKDRMPAQTMARHISEAEDTLAKSNSGSMVLHALDLAEKGLPVTVQPPRKWRLMRGEAHLKMGTVNSLGEAQNIAMTLLRNNSADPEALVLRGRALYGQGENEKAIQHFRQALSCDPDYKEGVKYLRMVQKLDRMKEEGNGHFKAGRYQQAVDVYTNALEVDPLNKGTNSKILNNRAMCHSRLKAWSSAISDCDRALQLDPSYTKARKTRAKALGEGGDWEEAVRAYKNIQEQSPEEPGIAKDIRNAEMELKKSKRKDYYKILGVEKDAGEKEISRAYKKMAVKWHPDKNMDDPEAENKFKEIQEAHETLTDPQKRERYDSGVDLMEPGEGFGGSPFGGGMGGMGGMGGGVQIDPEMLFNMMGGGGGGRGGGGFSFASGGMPGGMGGGGRRGGFGGGGGGFPFG